MDLMMRTTYTLNMGEESSSHTSVTTYQPTQRHIPEDLTFSRSYYCLTSWLKQLYSLIFKYCAEHPKVTISAYFYCPYFR